MAHSFNMLNTQENFQLLNQLSGAWFPSHETTESVLIEFQDPEECAHIRAEMAARSSAFV